METLRPRLNLLTDGQADAIIADALRVLEAVGFLVENGEALEMLRGAGLRIEAGRVFAPEESVRRALATTPGRVEVYDREGNPALDLGGDSVHFDPGSAAIHILDAGSRRHRPPVTRDLVHLAWVTGACRHVAGQSTGLVPTDVPGDFADRWRLAVALLNGAKPVVTGTFRKDGFLPMMAMLLAVRGSERALRERPLALFDCCPTPPLKWSDLTCQALVDCARSGIPAQLVSMPMGGISSPVTLREMVVQHCAECLSGVLIHQTAAPGAPVVYGGSPTAFDMRHGTTPMGAVETMMVECAYAQVGRRLGLPTHAYMALSDAKLVDYQAGLETGAGAVLAALAGVNLVSGPGMHDFESTMSLEKLLLDNEACGMALRLVQGVGHGSASEAVALIGRVVAEGSFLGHPHTRSHFRSEFLMPGRVLDRTGYGEWEKGPALDAAGAAAEEVRRILAKGNTTPPAPEVEREIRAIALAEAHRLGLDALPEA